jgi:hypothetical protein
MIVEECDMSSIFVSDIANWLKCFSGYIGFAGELFGPNRRQYADTLRAYKILQAKLEAKNGQDR